MLFVYRAIMSAQGNEMLAWFAIALGGSAILALYGSIRKAPMRRTALVLAGLTMTGLGVLGLLTIGLPIIVAGALALIAAARR